DNERLSTRYGCTNGMELLARTTKSSTTTLRQRVRLDRHTRTHSTLTGHERPAAFPEVAAALRSGRLGLDVAGYLTDEFTRLERRGGVSPHEMAVAEREIIASAVDGFDRAGGAARDAGTDEAPPE